MIREVLNGQPTRITYKVTTANYLTTNDKIQEYGKHRYGKEPCAEPPGC